MSSKRIAAVVFDLDDTLVHERDYVRSGYLAVARRVRERYGVDDFFARAWERFVAGRRERVFDEVLRGAGIEPSPAAIDELVACYREHEPTLALTLDAAECLDRLEGRYALALITDGYLVAQRAKLRALALAPRFRSVICTDALGREHWKPSPLAFRLTEETLGAPPQRCVYVADNPAKDFVAPRGRGWRTVRVRRADGVYRDTPAAEGGEPELTIDDLRALPGWLEGVDAADGVGESSG